MSDRILSSSHIDGTVSFVPSLLDRVWNAATENVFSFIQSNEWMEAVSRLAEAAVVNVFSNITVGQLVIVTPEKRYAFPADYSGANLSDENAEIRVIKSTFWVRLALMSDLGFAEAFMFGEADCDNLPSLFRLFLRNRTAISSLDSRFSYFFNGISQYLAKTRFMNSLGNSQGNISAHYDISNDMFMGFLSHDMTYSCAIFSTLDADLLTIQGDLLANTAAAGQHVSGTPSRDLTPPTDAFDSTALSCSPSLRGLAYTSVELESEEDMTTPSTLFGPGLRLNTLNKRVVRSLNGGDMVNGDYTPTLVDSPSSPTEHQESGTNQTDGSEYPEIDELYIAQMRKLDHIIRKADIRPGHRVLEIGSGWGSMALRIVQTIPETTVDTITLSKQQLQFVQQRIQDAVAPAGNPGGLSCSERIRVHLMDYRALPEEWKHSFDRIVSVEMIEAVGKEFLEVYWAQVDWALKPDTGAGVIQCITIPEARYESYSRGLDFIQKWSKFSLSNYVLTSGLLPSLKPCHDEWWQVPRLFIIRFPFMPVLLYFGLYSHQHRVVFPGGHLPTLAHLVSSLSSGSKGTLVVDSISNIGPHYARTLREWRKRFEWAFEDTIVPALKSEYPEVMNGPNGDKEIEVFRRKWIFYFYYCEIGFATRSLGDHIIAFAREGLEDYGCHVFN
ncbi:hypothetical protein QCA50_005394 [Cerrena zonata]|uniref:Cyclopropane-fatty-acyl-phospholipid synthase n=1 Tax=Cerrena zonata TaxID=2478898 RepID=A0AAW0GQZ9_9APHY